MAKLRILSGKEVCAILAEHGFEEVRKRGSHMLMQKKLSDTTVTVPVPDHKEIRAGTLLLSSVSPVYPGLSLNE